MKNSNEKPKLPNDACLIETPGRRQFSVVDEYEVFSFTFLPLSYTCKAWMANWSFTERSEVNHRLTCL